MWLTKKAHWLTGKFLKEGGNHIVAVFDSLQGQTSWYVNGELVGRLSDSMGYFPYEMSADWIRELYNLGCL